MPEKIFLIGSGLKKHADTLSASGYSVCSFNSTGKALEAINDALLIILDRDHKDSWKELTKASKKIPKLVLSHDESSRKLGPWLREPIAYPLHNPSDKEILYYASRLIKESQMAEKVCLLSNDLNAMKEELAFFEEMNKALTSSKDINDILVTIMKRVQDMTGAAAWSILLVDDETGDLVFERTRGNANKAIKKMRLKPGEGIAGWVAQKGVPLVVPDVMKDRRFSYRVDRFSRFKTKSVMCAPILSKGDTLGVLEVINKKNGGSFTQDDLNLLLKLVNQAALAVERILLYQKLEELVVTDDLTKLFNTRHLHRSIESEVQRSKRYSSSVSLIFMDLDHFKDINDNYGHLVGSKVLVEVGQILINQLRSIDTVARYGGDEFVIVLPQTVLKNAMAIAERIRKAIAKHIFLKSEGYNLNTTASFGVASYPESASSREELIKLADESMYSVKKRTRNGVYAII
jgi:diguanylate cyclase (GGDEF)-like protein